MHKLKDYTWWSNIRLDDEIAFRVRSLVSPVPWVERTTPISPMLNCVVNETKLISPMLNGVVNEKLKDFHKHSGAIYDGGARQWSLRPRTNARSALEYYSELFYEAEVIRRRMLFRIYENVRIQRR